MDVLWGRDREIGVLHRLAGSRTGTGVVIVGEPGIGKSALWTNGVAALRGSGARVLISTGAEAESGMPYAGLEDLLGDLLDQYGAALPRPQRAALDAAFVRTYRDDGACTRSEIAVGPRSVAVGALTLLRHVLDEGPVVLAVDDLQWLDGETLTCLAYAVRRLGGRPLVRLLSARSDSPLWSPADEPADSAALRDGVPTLRPAPLGAVAIRGLLEQRLGVVLSPEEGRRIAEQTGGNPFWALEFGRSWRGLFEGARPASLGALLADRVHRLDPEVVETASMVAALGRPRSAAVVRAVGSTDDARAVAEELDRAVAAGLVTVVGDRVTPSHPVVGAALLASLMPFRRQRLHLLAADCAESVEARAAHLLRANAEVDTERPSTLTGPQARRRCADLIDALDAACAAARDRGAPGVAARFAAHALGVAASLPECARSHRERTVRTAELYDRAGDRDTALELLERLDLATLDPELVERAAPLLARLLDARRGGAAARAVADALDTAPACPAHRDRRQALVAALRADPSCGALGDRVGYARQAVALAEAAGPALRRRALAVLAAALFDAGEPVDAVLDRYDALGEPDDDVAVLRGLRRWRCLDVAGARQVFGAAFERRLRTGDAAGIVRVGALLARVDLLTTSAEAAGHTLARVAEHVDRACVRRLGMVDTRHLLHLVRGEHDELDALLEDADDRSVASALCAARLRGAAALHRENPAHAVAFLDQHLAIAARHGIHTVDPDVLTDLAEALIAVGDHPRATQVAGQLDAAARDTGNAVVRGQHLRVLARLTAHRDQNLARAVALARDAVALHARTPVPSACAHSMVTLADMHDLRGEPEQAAQYRRRAQALFAGIGYRRQAVWLTRHEAATGQDHALSSSERTVANLVAGGATNREAAATLHLSVRTIENHLYAVFRKLDIRSRTELTDHPAILAGMS